MSLTIIGGGNMGLAIATRVLDKGIVSQEQLIVIDPSDQKREQIVFELGCKSYGSLTDKTVGESDTVVLAVKPQTFTSLKDTLCPVLQSTQLVISVMAGVSLDTLRTGLNNHPHLVRAMPNMPAKIGEGMTVLHASGEVHRDKKELALDIFRAVGEVLYVENEDLVDAATALSGSGPGFVFSLLEGFLGGASRVGFSDDQAKLLVRQTFKGAVRLWNESGENAAELRRQVTSPGGTTEAGLNVLKESSVGSALENAITAAYKRAKELQQSSK